MTQALKERYHRLVQINMARSKLRNEIWLSDDTPTKLHLRLALLIKTIYGNLSSAEHQGQLVQAIQDCLPDEVNILASGTTFENARQLCYFATEVIENVEAKPKLVSILNN